MRSFIIALLLILPSQGYAEWISQYANPNQRFRSIYSIDSLTAVAWGNELPSYDDIIIRTTDGGLTWEEQFRAFVGEPRSLYFADRQRGWAVGGWNTVVKSIDGGESWTLLSSGTDLYHRSVFFSDSLTGWTAGTDYRAPFPRAFIQKSTDGGISWNRQYYGSVPTPYLNSIHFLDEQNGWAVGSDSALLRTKDGGGTWTSQSVDSLWCDLYDVFFSDEMHGWIAGRNDLSQAIVVSTTDGGINWSTQVLPGATLVYSIVFVNALDGWVAGGGVIYGTINGGENWNLQLNDQPLGLRSVHFGDVDHGWACGWSGTIVGTKNGGGVATSVTPSRVYETQLAQNYPNPFNPSTAIPFTLPRWSIVQLSIYDIEGHWVTTLVDDHLDGGPKEIIWNGRDARGNPVSSGVYFYRLAVGGETVTKKAVVLR